MASALSMVDVVNNAPFKDVKIRLREEVFVSDMVQSRSAVSLMDVRIKPEKGVCVEDMELRIVSLEKQMNQILEGCLMLSKRPLSMGSRKKFTI